VSRPRLLPRDDYRARYIRRDVSRVVHIWSTSWSDMPANVPHFMSAPYINYINFDILKGTYSTTDSLRNHDLLKLWYVLLNSDLIAFFLVNSEDPGSNYGSI
jgi:hypothetical protein